MNRKRTRRFPGSRAEHFAGYALVSGVLGVWMWLETDYLLGLPVAAVAVWCTFFGVRAWRSDDP